MYCLQSKFKKKDRKSGNRCPKCGHRFVLDPKTDGVTDGFMKKAVIAVSSNGTFKYLPAQLDHEILRRSRPVTFIQRLARRKSALAIFIAGLSFAAFVALSDAEPGFLAYVIIAMATFWAVKKFWGPAAMPSRGPRNPKMSLLRYEKVNSAAGKIVLGPKLSSHGGEGATFNRVLVCEHPAYRDFFLANDFHLHHACHVMGPGDLETQEGRELLDELKKMPTLDVFIVHDATPRGARFAHAVRSEQRWFAAAASDNILDLGLVSGQLSLFESMLRPLTPKELRDIDEGENGIFATMGADLSAIPAGPLMLLTGASVDERLPFHENSYTERKRKGTSSNRDIDEWWLYIAGDGE